MLPKDQKIIYINIYISHIYIYILLWQSLKKRMILDQKRPIALVCLNRRNMWVLNSRE